MYVLYVVTLVRVQARGGKLFLKKEERYTLTQEKSLAAFSVKVPTKENIPSSKRNVCWCVTFKLGNKNGDCSPITDRSRTQKKVATTTLSAGKCTKLCVCLCASHGHVINRPTNGSQSFCCLCGGGSKICKFCLGASPPEAEANFGGRRLEARLCRRNCRLLM